MKQHQITSASPLTPNSDRDFPGGKVNIPMILTAGSGSESATQIMN